MIVQTSKYQPIRLRCDCEKIGTNVHIVLFAVKLCKHALKAERGKIRPQQNVWTPQWRSWLFTAALKWHKQT